MTSLIFRYSTSLGLSNDLVVNDSNDQCSQHKVSSLISAAEAIKHFNENNNVVKFVDSSWHLNKTRKGKEEFLHSRIPGASFFDIDDVSDKRSSLPHMLPSEKLFEEQISSMGISSHHHVIVYATAGSFSAPRVWWTFKVFGHNRVSVLDGGLPAWIAADGPTESGPYVSAESKGTFTANLNSNMVVDRNYVLNLVNSGMKGQQLLDARSKGRFLGLEPEPRPGLPSGHMPGSLSLPFSAVVANGDVTRFKSKEEISAAFQEAGLVAGDKAVLSCGSGVSAAVLCLALDVLGRDISESVAIYDGSWTEWASTDGSPIVSEAPKPATA
eukprot:CAMPEP_0170079392 /NCGR_PEP_ID=MMETSP0019_2-20121128/15784_1 /TAXON_ID=98059 /ORGANISM="Dinobryon sp., Strain UTEXLB2267" /LENGTH=326 /DNA_ID=CAMNT_0010292825 /DNA_START=54 /DNA_END=1030 /DNA_ORIENTATION=+